MKSMVEQCGEAARGETAGHWQRYAELLVDDNPTPDKVKALKAAMTALGRSVGDLEADRRVLQIAAESRRVIGEKPTDAEDAAASSAIQVNFVKMSEEVARLKLEHQKLVNRATEISGRMMNAREAANRIERLRSQHPELLASY